MTTKKRTHGLQGWFGHSLDEQGKIDWQFEIVRTLADGRYECQLFSWLTGAETEVTFLSEAELRDPAKHRLYPSLEEWLDAAEKYSRMGALRREREERMTVDDLEGNR